MPNKTGSGKIDPLLVNHKLPVINNVNKIIKKSEKIIQNVNLNKIMMFNKYEKMIPFNLWFRHPLYQIYNNYENNQNIRIRYFDNIMLTPLVSIENNNLEKIKFFLPSMSLYQPFYQETFYAIWEFLQMKHINLESKYFLHIGREERLGTMEAIIFYHEKYQHTYQYNNYHIWITGKEMFDILNNEYNIICPKNNFLGQAYKIKFMKSTSELVKYHFISIDCIHLFENIFQWNEEEMDLHATLFYLLTALEHLEIGGAMLIRLNMISSKSWAIIFDIVYYFFKEHTFFRPSTLNPFNSEIYLFLNKYESKTSFNSVFTNTINNKILKNLYRQHIYIEFYLNVDCDLNNPIYQKYLIEINLWTKKLTKILENFSSYKIPTKDYVSDWHASNDLKQIKHLSNMFDDKPSKQIFKTSAKNFTLKPTVPKILYNMQFYRKLIQKRAELNYYKRVMDTKPSQIFSENRYHNNRGYLLTYEQLSNQIDVYRDLKHILKKQYNTEMMTNAWVKMYEMLNMFPDLIPSETIVKTFHLCEAPGAFISALNHIVSNRNQKLDWYAQTLKPTINENTTNDALEDHFGLIASYPNRWLFGDKNIDESGDITHSAIIKFYASNPNLKNIDFMTADAGLQCDPTELNEQEAFLGKINMGQIICILACLSIGKSAIFKTFLPMSEPLTISMMYLVTHLFTEVTITKPNTSHHSNSEVYIILQKYKGINESVLEMLYMMLDDPKITSKSLLFSMIDMTFFGSYMSNIGLFIDRQIQSLNRNYYYYYHYDQIDNLKETIDKSIDIWLSLNPIFILKNKLLTDN